ncbi:hypothetical protein AB0K09_15680 [Streptomyces sp. NPDC049577]|uniref:hypothetical protein n=1 Tax=Streptomyces sp. NPDC049577 TaxID=3155153 RepID=UPI0034177126
MDHDSAVWIPPHDASAAAEHPDPAGVGERYDVLGFFTLRPDPQPDTQAPPNPEPDQHAAPRSPR